MNGEPLVEDVGASDLPVARPCCGRFAALRCHRDGKSSILLDCGSCTEAAGSGQLDQHRTNSGWIKLRSLPARQMQTWLGLPDARGTAALLSGSIFASSVWPQTQSREYGRLYTCTKCIGCEVCQPRLVRTGSMQLFTVMRPWSRLQAFHRARSVSIAGQFQLCYWKGLPVGPSEGFGN